MPGQAPPKRWWHPDIHVDRRPLLLARVKIRKAIRDWFEAQGFIEVETACLQVSPGNETHLHAFRTERIGSDLQRSPFHLHTSPEFAMKKLLAAGEGKIFSFAPVFRNRERGRLHAPEFTMLEWYRAEQHDDRDQGLPQSLFDLLQRDCEDIVRLAAGTVGDGMLRWGGHAARTDAAFETLAVADMLQPLGLAAGYSAAECTDIVLKPSFATIADLACRRGHRVAPEDTWSSLFSLLLSEREAQLGLERPLILLDYPASEAALARLDPINPALAQRFELYACGVELANAFAELNDSAEQRRRFELQMAEKERIYGERYPIDEDFLAALQMMPDAAGCALGFDRLVMLATGAEHIDQVIWTPMAPETS